MKPPTAIEVQQRIAAAQERIAKALEDHCRFERIELKLAQMEALIMAGTEQSQETLRIANEIKQNADDYANLVQKVSTDVATTLAKLAEVQALLELEQEDNENVRQANEILIAANQQLQVSEEALARLVPATDPPTDPTE